MTERQKKELGDLKGRLINLLHQESVVRGVACYRLANERHTEEERQELKGALERADFLIPRSMCGLVILMLGDDVGLRAQFIADPDCREPLIEEIVAQTAEPGKAVVDGVLAAIEATIAS